MVTISSPSQHPGSGDKKHSGGDLPNPLDDEERRDRHTARRGKAPIIERQNRSHNHRNRAHISGLSF